MTVFATPAIIFNHDNLTLTLVGEGSNGHEQLYVNGTLVSEQPNSDLHGSHTFHWQDHSWRFQFHILAETRLAHCQLYQGNTLLHEADVLVEAFEFQGSEPEHAAEQSAAPAAQSNFSFVALIAIGMKLLKSAKAIQVALVGASVASYSFLFDWRFAVIIVMALMFHEYGHMQAMKKMGMKVKGMYLIPFLGGAAVSSDRIKTRWENVYISMMGPVYGLIMTITFFMVYRFTGHSLAAGLAAFSALLNLINLLPIMPLDGGQVVKSIAFSIHSKVGTVVLWLGIALAIFITFYLGMTLFGFLAIIGALDVLFGGNERKNTHITPLTGTGIFVSTVWYVGTIAALIGMILLMAHMGLAGSQIVTEILGS
ncbi:MAG: site-2 protease family protein [Reinekea sp.]|nr:site-2 protease family protein [Reinekea sp.]